MDRLELEHIINHIKNIILLNEKKGKYNTSFCLIKLCASILYEANIYYYDSFLEECTERIAKKIFPLEKYESNEDVIVFYDGFGLDSRGLAQIYLSALCKSYKKIIYITDIRYSNRIPKITSILNQNNSSIEYINPGSLIDMFTQICSVMIKYNVGQFFFYSTPDDVIGVSVMNVFSDFVKMYQINLTDHSFWLGAKPIDVCIEFRDYGANISNEYRNISKDKIICIPFYPIIDYEAKFENYPFSFDKPMKIVFSGGALYKTFGDENKYYDIINYILKTYSNVIFWYAGSGDDTEIKVLQKKYPNRVFLTSERKDLYQVIKHCYLYINTYPVCGGLMFQYAARAGKIPLTLKHSSISDGFLINQSELGVELNSLEEIYCEIDKLFCDEDYLHSKEKQLEDSVISSDIFDDIVNKLIVGVYASPFLVNYSHVDTSDFTKIYLDRLSNKKINSLIGCREFFCLFKYMPLRYMSGALSKLINKILKRWQ